MLQQPRAPQPKLKCLCGCQCIIWSTWAVKQQWWKELGGSSSENRHSLPPPGPSENLGAIPHHFQKWTIVHNRFHVLQTPHNVVRFDIRILLATTKLMELWQLFAWGWAPKWPKSLLFATCLSFFLGKALTLMSKDWRKWQPPVCILAWLKIGALVVSFPSILQGGCGVQMVTEQRCLWIYCAT